MPLIGIKRIDQGLSIWRCLPCRRSSGGRRGQAPNRSPCWCARTGRNRDRPPGNRRGYRATRHLIDLGHRRIAIIAGPAYASSSRKRLESYRKALAEAGIPESPDLIQGSTFGIDSGAEVAERSLALRERPTAIFAINDKTAIGVLSALTRAGLSVPGDISLVGYNDVPIVSQLLVPLTSVRVPFEQIAAMALELLEATKEPRELIMRAAPTLIPRESTAQAPVRSAVS